ncbi:MAG: polysaccharide deacetylase family protein [Myxococcales bacterium]|nr:MAG: polysaccharide deacetylase family protein [Myxococcales bacterium]
MKALPPARLGLWAYAMTGVALGARSVMAAPPPLLPTLFGLGGYLALGTAGVFWPERGMYGSLLWHGPRDRAEVALTFDDGPSPDTTPQVLSQLAAAGVRATFFLVGRKVERHPELVREIVAAGHQVGLHGYAHDRLFSLRRPAHVAEDVRRSQAVLERAGAPLPTLFRPPIGFVSHFTVNGARKANVTLVGCSARALDGLRGASASKVGERLVRALEPGALLAMHDAAERDDYVPASIAALPQVLAAIRERGLRPVTLGAWT